MNNAASRKLYEKPEEEITLAPVIPIKSVMGEIKKAKDVSVKPGLRKSVPDFTEAVFKPKKHDML
ncbi:MAG: hypothetical protein WDO19_25710 [Bacteroidota bacterium]